MHIGLWNYYEELNHPDLMFNPASYKLGYGLEQPFVQLRDLASAHGSTVEPYYVDSSVSWDAVIFFDYPSRSSWILESLKKQNVPIYLVVLESTLHNRDNARSDLCSVFDTVFTWSTRASESEQTVHSPIPQDLTFVRDTVPWSQRRFSCLVAGNKDSSDPQALYKERKRLIRWFEAHHPQEFDLFGFGWEAGEELVPSLLRRIFTLFQLQWRKPFPSFRGPVGDKRALLSNYRFSFCLENVQGSYGYITEKIFDGMLAGTVPIYLGAPDIGKWIPEDCYLHLSHFSSIKKLYQKMYAMTESEHLEILRRQRQFLAGPEGRRFSAVGFAERIWGMVSQSR